jgi:hypothetical protein
MSCRSDEAGVVPLLRQSHQTGRLGVPIDHFGRDQGFGYLERVGHGRFRRLGSHNESHFTHISGAVGLGKWRYPR